MSRYSWGADEFLFVELAEEMSLRANFRAMAIATKLRERRPEGLLDICPANASYQVRFDPDRLAPADVERLLRDVDEEVGDAHAGAPWFASMVGFVAGLPFLYQMVPRERQLEVPKYVRPRTDTPALTIGHGGCFGCIYSVRGAGGYQMFGITPAPIYDPTQTKPDFTEHMVFMRPGDIVKFRPVDRDEYDDLQAKAEAGEFRITARPVEFDLQPFLDDSDGYNERLLGVLA